MKVKDFLTVLLNASEKAARISRTCRSNKCLFQLLIEEKTGDDKNERFFQDFKTLADVVIQQSVQYEIGKVFPKLKENVKGEESNKFENVLGEKIIFEVEDDSDKTFDMLLKVLDKNKEAARELTNQIHSSVESEEIKNLPDIDDELNDDDDDQIGIWIDPIDGTQEYINGNDQTSDFPNIQKSGLKCATVLIGAYNKSTGEPFLGVINQPFAIETDGTYKSQIFYGISLNNGHKYTNVTQDQSSEKLAIISSSENANKISFKTVASAGAGYKALKVIEGHADIYFLTKGSTFKWDTCASQAILRSLGGGGDIVDFKLSIASCQAIPLNYRDDENKCNEHGIIAFRNFDNFLTLCNDFNSS